MRLVSACCLLLALVLTASVVMADPANQGQKPWGIVIGQDRTTYPEQEPNDTCPGQAVACGDVVNPASLVTNDQDWYTFSANAGDQLTLGTGTVDGTSTDTYIELYANDCVTMLTYNDDGGGNLFSLIQNFTAPYTGVYNLKVRGFGGYVTGLYQVFFNCGTPPPPPTNDTCDGAIEIPRCSAGSLQGDLTAYNNNYDPGPTGCTGYAAAGKDAVYFMNLVAGDQVSMTYTQLAYDASFYIVTDCANMASCVAGADDTVTGQPETINYTAATTGIYYVILDCYGSGTGAAWTLDYNVFCPPPPEPEACCFADGHCEMQLPADCSALGGTPMGAGTTCDTVTCEVVPTQTTTWGQIRSSYR